MSSLHFYLFNLAKFLFLFCIRVFLHKISAFGSFYYLKYSSNLVLHVPGTENTICYSLLIKAGFLKKSITDIWGFPLSFWCQ